MSSSRLVLVLLVALGGCGFQPLYGQRGASGSASVQGELAAIKIEMIADRTGQQLYNFLRDRLNPLGRPASPRYLLSVGLDEDLERLSLRGDETATRANLTLTANLTLKRFDSGDVVYRGISRSTTSYNILTAQYATLVSEKDARERGVRDLSEDIRTRLAIALADQRAAAP